MDVHRYEPHLEAAAELGIRHVLSNIMTADRGFYTEQFGELCRLAAVYGQDVNVEFVILGQRGKSQADGGTAEGDGPPNVGIVVDALHFYRSRVNLKELEGLPKEWFRFMHLCDTIREIPDDPEMLIHTGRKERLYPGKAPLT